MGRAINIAKIGLRMALGLVFIFSAITKLLSIDSLEIYIFSFKLFSLEVSFLLSRLLIAFEAILGIWLLSNINNRYSFWCSFATLACFTIFLLFLSLTGNQDNCNCFGEFIKMNPKESIVKNLIMILLLISTYNTKSFKIKKLPLWGALISIAVTATVFIISPPDNWRYESYQKHTEVNIEALEEAKAKNIIPAELFEGEKIVCLFSLKCNYCIKAAKKISILRDRGEFSNGDIHIIFGGDEKDTREWFDNTKMQAKSFSFLPANDFLSITYGSIPLILHLKDGEIIEKYSFRDIRKSND